MDAAPDWFDTARFGMFVHWGHSTGRELSWPLVGGTEVLPHSHALPVGEYQATAASFDPTPGAAREWAALARRAGMRYAVLTTRHHDGFSMFHTRHSDFSVEHSPYGGDIVGEFVEAVRGEGLRVGLYYSLSDWHHPDYPAFTDDDRPYQFIAYPRPDPDAWERYLAYLFGQVEELLTNYGPIDVLWFDGGWERTAAEWRSDDLRALIRSLQPNTLVNDRLPGHGDFTTPEQFVPPEAPEGRWETCLTMNESWGWCPEDTDYKSARDLVHVLCEVAGRGGNLLLNVSPRGDGSLPPEQIELLEHVAAWMDRHGAAITGTDAGLAPWQVYGSSTRAADRVFVHLLLRPYERVTVRGLPVRRVRHVRDLATGRELTWRSRGAVLDQLLNADPHGEVAIDVPEDVVDPLATVLEIEIAGSPSA